MPEALGPARSTQTRWDAGSLPWNTRLGPRPPPGPPAGAWKGWRVGRGAEAHPSGVGSSPDTAAGAAVGPALSLHHVHLSFIPRHPSLL